MKITSNINVTKSVELNSSFFAHMQHNCNNAHIIYQGGHAPDEDAADYVKINTKVVRLG